MCVVARVDSGWRQVDVGVVGSQEVKERRVSWQLGWARAVWA